MSDEHILGLRDVYDEVKNLGTEVRNLATELRSDQADQRSKVAVLESELANTRGDVADLTQRLEDQERERTRNRWALVLAIIGAAGSPAAVFLTMFLQSTGKG